MTTPASRLLARLGGIGLLAAVVGLQGCATAELHSQPPVHVFDVPGQAGDEATLSTLRVMTLNLAHGRGEAFHQMLQQTESTLHNLNMISTMLQREQPDVVALQEADGPSYWSGNFNHVDYLARRGAYSNAVNGNQVQGLGLEYGTALLSDRELRYTEAVTFNPDLAVTPKGFVVSTIDWPGMPRLQVDVVSLHLDFSSEKTRRQQARELIEVMRDRDRPMIVMGDFNTDWHDRDTTVRLIVRELGLNAFDPGAPGQATFPFRGKRLDWIMVSAGLEFRDYQVVTDPVSDHRGVIAELGLGSELVRNTRR